MLEPVVDRFGTPVVPTNKLRPWIGCCYAPTLGMQGRGFTFTFASGVHVPPSTRPSCGPLPPAPLSLPPSPPPPVVVLDALSLLQVSEALSGYLTEVQETEGTVKLELQALSDSLVQNNDLPVIAQVRDAPLPPPPPLSVFFIPSAELSFNSRVMGLRLSSRSFFLPRAHGGRLARTGRRPRSTTVCDLCFVLLARFSSKHTIIGLGSVENKTCDTCG